MLHERSSDTPATTLGSDGDALGLIDFEGPTKAYPHDGPGVWAGRIMDDHDFRLTLPDGSRLLAEAHFNLGRVAGRPVYKIAGPDGYLSEAELGAALVQTVRACEGPPRGGWKGHDDTEPSDYRPDGEGFPW